MSVLIKGMEMPENCIKCPMQFGGFCYVQPPDIDEARVAPTVDEAWEQGKPEWCPLVEIPTPHGRLIDGDELKTAFPRMDNPTDVKIHSVRATINHMPTVIEAEE